MIYLDNAATTFPKPDLVICKMAQAQRFGANPGRGGHKMSVNAGNIVFETREKIAKMFSCAEERVIFTKNCTESLNTAIKGLVKRGDHIIVSSLEHNSVIRPIEKLKEKEGVTYDVAYVEPKDEEQTVENFRKLIRKETRLIVCTHVSNVFGTVLPVRKIARMAKNQGLLFVLDAAQSAGAFEIDMSEGLFDCVCMPGHKGLFGPMGTGVMLIADGILPDSFIEGGTGSLSLVRTQPEAVPDRFESGTLNLPGVAGLCAGIDFINKHGGVRTVHEYEMSLCNLFVNDLKQIYGITVYDNMFSSERAPVVSFALKNMHSEETAQLLDDAGFAVRGGYHCSYIAHSSYNTSENGTVRVSPGFFNTKKQIKSLSFCLNKIAKQ